MNKELTELELQKLKERLKEEFSDYSEIAGGKTGTFISKRLIN